MLWTRRTVLVPAVALLVLALWAPSASAHEQHLEWRDGDKAGDCTGGWTSGGYVFSVQSILYASGLLSASGVDGVWGPVTESASRTWQSRHGLTADGCWGYYTWNKAQHGYHNVSIGGETVRFNHMTLTSQSNPNDIRWRYEEGNLQNGRRIAYAFRYDRCWYVDPPGTRGFTLVSHPGDTSCSYP